MSDSCVWDMKYFLSVMVLLTQQREAAAINSYLEFIFQSFRTDLNSFHCAELVQSQVIVAAW